MAAGLLGYTDFNHSFLHRLLHHARIEVMAALGA
jgi:hypothetical protein